jgi:FAD/FMN-containing dehydrogenase
VGIDKRDYMPLVHGPEELAAMAAAKAVFDPDGLFNPDKVLPLRTQGTEPAAGAEA